VIIGRAVGKNARQPADRRETVPGLVNMSRKLTRSDFPSSGDARSLPGSHRASDSYRERSMSPSAFAGV